VTLRVGRERWLPKKIKQFDGRHIDCHDHQPGRQDGRPGNQSNHEEMNAMDARMVGVKKLGRIVMLAVLVAIGGELTLPLMAHASRRPHCAAVPVPGQPGTSVVRCTVQRP
jgi:hypothetical protein